MSCNDCGLYQYSKCPKIQGKGNNVNPQLVLIGEAPGPDEADQGTVFIGRAGKLLDKMLEPYKHISMYITNAVKCFPPLSTKDPSKGFRVPKVSEINLCRANLFEELLELTNTPVLMPMGNTALTSLFGNTHKGITKELGTRHIVAISANDENTELRNYLVVPNYHPSYVLRNPRVLIDFDRVMKVVVQDILPHVDEVMEHTYADIRAKTDS